MAQCNADSHMLVTVILDVASLFYTVLAFCVFP